MSIYKEAIADATKLRELALKNAKDAVLKEIEPKIKRMINQQILCEISDDEDTEDILLGNIDAAIDPDSAVDLDSALDAPPPPLPIEPDLALEPGLASEPSPIEEPAMPVSDEIAGITLPDDEGKVTIDLDAFVVPEESDGVVLTPESIKKIKKLIPSKQSKAKLESKISAFEAFINNNDGSRASKEQIDEMLHNIRNIYFSLDNNSKFQYRLEEAYDKLKNIKNESMNENELKVTIAGLPDEIDLSNVSASIDDIEAGEASGTEDYEFSDDEGIDGKDMKEIKDDTTCEEEETDEMLEGDLEITLSGLPDDIDAGELSLTIDDLEGEEEEGDDDLEDEEEPLDSEEDEFEFSDDDVVEIDETMLKQEVARMRKLYAKRLAEESVPPCVGKKPGASQFKDFGGADEEDELFTGYDDADLNKLESIKRRRLMRQRMGMGNKIQKIREAKMQRELVRLQKELKAAQLFNSKMIHANKLLQSEGLSEKQKGQIIESLDNAKTIREVKLIYRSLTKSTTRRSKLTEQRRRGSGSRTVKRAGTKQTLNEGNDHVARWGELAGIKEG